MYARLLITFLDTFIEISNINVEVGQVKTSSMVQYHVSFLQINLHFLDWKQ